MKRMLFGLIALVPFALDAEKPKQDKAQQEVQFINSDKVKVELTIRNRKNGRKIEDKTLRPQEHFNFTLQPDINYTVQARELEGEKLMTPLNYLYLRERFSLGTVTIKRTTRFFSKEEILTFVGQNVVVREPWIKPDWAQKKKQDKVPK